MISRHWYLFLALGASLLLACVRVVIPEPCPLPRIDVQRNERCALNCMLRGDTRPSESLGCLRGCPGTVVSP